MALTDKLTAIGDAIREKTGETDKMTLREMPDKIRSIEGGGSGNLNDDVVEFDAQNPYVTAYLTAASASYTEGNTSTTSVASSYFSSTWDYRDMPLSKSIVTTGASVIYLVDEESGNGTVDSCGDAYIVRNLIPSHVYRWWAENSSGVTVANGRIKANGSLRQIYVDPNARNFRDIGGKRCDGGTVRYGLFFRGSQIDGDFVTTSETIRILHDVCGIRTEIDMRESPPQNYSLIGNDVEYLHIALPDSFGNYHWVVTRDAEVVQAKNIIKGIIEAVRYGRPVYLHCTYGADRTGTICALIEGMLGVDRVEIDEDYEMTNLAFGNKYRTNSLYVNLIAQINNLSGDTFMDKCLTWARSCGITSEEINAFRSAMVDGNPTIVDWSTGDDTGSETDYPVNPEIAWTQGYNLSYTDGVTTSANNNYAYCDYIPVDVNATYTSDMVMAATDSNYRVLCYDSSQSFLGVGFASQANGSSWCVGTKYSTCAYVRLRLYAKNASAIAQECAGFVLTKS